MSDNVRISELLLRWQEARQQGHILSVTELCRDDPQLTEAVQRAIDSIHAMETLLGIDEHGVLQPHTADAGQNDSAPFPTPQIPGYEIVQQLGYGAMGVVYRVRQLNLSRFVAMKMLNSEHCPEHHISRFRTEAESVAQLQHPHIVQIYDVGEVAGRPFYTMELMGGGTLSEKLDHARLSPCEAATLIGILAGAVHAAHLRDIVHRDLKPANVLLTADDTVKIADFGLAKRLDSDSSHTKTGVILGTPCYMAPEQANAASEQIGPAVDIYALGAILYEMLVGEPPFKATTALESMRRLTTEDAAFPTDMRTKIPKGLQAICLKCLEKSPQRRYATAAALADDLQQFLAGRPILARPTSAFGRLVKWSRRHPELAIVSLAACVLGMALIVSMATQRWQQRRHATRIAPQAREILKRNCYECHGENSDKIERNLNVLDHGSLIANTRDIVIPGASDNSRLIQRITDGSMPPEADEVRLPRVSEKELTILRAWIQGGAPRFPEEVPGQPTPAVIPVSGVAGEVKQIFLRHCYECHSYDLAKGGIKILNHRLLLTVRKVILPGQPEDSELYQLIAPNSDDFVRMPPAPAKRLSDAEIETVRRWIAEGAVPFPKGPPPAPDDSTGISD